MSIKTSSHKHPAAPLPQMDGLLWDDWVLGLYRNICHLLWAKIMSSLLLFLWDTETEVDRRIFNILILPRSSLLG